MHSCFALVIYLVVVVALAQYYVRASFPQHVYNMKENADDKKWAYARCLFCLGAGTAVAGSLGATRFPGWVEGAIGIGTSGTSAFGGGGGGRTGSSGGGGNAGGVR